MLKNASGVIRQKVHEVFNNTLRESEMTELCTLIYYPAEKLQLWWFYYIFSSLGGFAYPSINILRTDISYMVGIELITMFMT